MVGEHDQAGLGLLQADQEIPEACKNVTSQVSDAPSRSEQERTPERKRKRETDQSNTSQDHTAAAHRSPNGHILGTEAAIVRSHPYIFAQPTINESSRDDSDPGSQERHARALGFLKTLQVLDSFHSMLSIEVSTVIWIRFLSVWVLLGNHPRQHLISLVGWKRCNPTD